jgi:YD repeat-containing protein
VLEKDTEGNVILYEYDVDTIGALDSVTSDDDVTESFSYDERLRPVEKTVDNGGIIVSMQYEYDSLDRVTAKTIDGQRIDYDYGPQGMTLLNNLVSISYDENSNPMQRTYGNGLVSVWSYDDLQRPNNIQTGLLQDLDYTYDSVGSITQINDNVRGDVMQMSYDDIDRLVSATRTGANAYSIDYNYDSIGNILSVDSGGDVMARTYGNRAHGPATIAIPAQPLCGGCTEWTPSLNAGFTLVGTSGRELQNSVSGEAVTSASELLSALGCTIAYHWTGSSWQLHLAGTTLNDFTLNDAEGYFVYCGWDVSPTVDVVTSGISFDSTFDVGFNLVSLPSSMDGTLIEDVLVNINSQAPQCGFAYRFTGTQWQVHLAGYGLNNFAVEDGEGYFVYCTEGGVAVVG